MAHKDRKKKIRYKGKLKDLPHYKDKDKKKFTPPKFDADIDIKKSKVDYETGKETPIYTEKFRKGKSQGRKSAGEAFIEKYGQKERRGDAPPMTTPPMDAEIPPQIEAGTPEEMERDWLGRLPPEERERLLQLRKEGGSEWEIFKSNLPWNRGEGFGGTMKEVGKDIMDISAMTGVGKLGEIPKGIRSATQIIKNKEIFQGTRKKLLKDLLDGRFKTGSNELSIGKVMQRTRVTRKKAIRMIREWDTIDVGRKMELLSKPIKTRWGVGKKIGVGAGLTAAGGLGLGFAWKLMDADSIMTWFALDNILSSLGFLVPKAEEAMAAGTLDREGAMELFDEADVARDLAMNQARNAPTRNPALYSYAKLIESGATLANSTYELQKGTFMGGQNTGRYRPTWDSNVQTQAPDPIDALRGNQ